MTARGIIASAVLFLTLGCASGPIVQLQDVKKSLPPVPAGMGRAYFYRSSTFAAEVSPDVRLNGVVIGEAKAGTVFFRDLKPGGYQVEVSTETTNESSFAIAAGDTKYIRFDVTAGFFVGHVKPVNIPLSQGSFETNDLSIEGWSPPRAVRQAAAPPLNSPTRTNNAAPVR
ncbi:MAG: DUF2846 domain-containing protein [Bdellovibrionota bacterium]